MPQSDRRRGTHVVTAFVRHEGDVLFVQREDAPSPAERWDGVSLERDAEPADPEAAARDGLETQVGIESATLVRRGRSISVETDGRVVYPLLFTVDTRATSPSESVASAAWFPPPEMRGKPTVPGLWRAYRQVAPTVETVAEDTEHGSARLSIRALEALRDRAAVADDWETAAAVARELRAAHPDMAALTNRINRAMARSTGVVGDVDEPESTPEAVVAAARRTLSEAIRADERAAERAAATLDGDATVATLSRSGTVFDALVDADPAVVIGESRPAGEGRDVAAELAAADVAVTLTTDAALPWAISGEADQVTPEVAPDAVLVGADAVLPDGAIVNKVGTRALGLAAARSEVPLYAVAARDKVALADRRPTVQSDASPLAPAAGVETWVPTFDRTPPDCVDGIVTEDGVLAPEDVEEVAASHRRHASWDSAVDD